MRGPAIPGRGWGVGTAAAVATGLEQPREASTCVGEGGGTPLVQRPYSNPAAGVPQEVGSSLV